jgi:hypothetical protein
MALLNPPAMSGRGVEHSRGQNILATLASRLNDSFDLRFAAILLMSGARQARPERASLSARLVLSRISIGGFIRRVTRRPDREFKVS